MDIPQFTVPCPKDERVLLLAWEVDLYLIEDSSFFDGSFQKFEKVLCFLHVYENSDKYGQITNALILIKCLIIFGI